jgi:hypothetical protein
MQLHKSYQSANIELVHRTMEFSANICSSQHLRRFPFQLTLCSRSRRRVESSEIPARSTRRHSRNPLVHSNSPLDCCTWCSRLRFFTMHSKSKLPKMWVSSRKSIKDFIHFFPPNQTLQNACYDCATSRQLVIASSTWGANAISHYYQLYKSKFTISIFYVLSSASYQLPHKSEARLIAWSRDRLNWQLLDSSASHHDHGALSPCGTELHLKRERFIARPRASHWMMSV